MKITIIIGNMNENIVIDIITMLLQAMLMLTKKSSKESLLINMDGLRAGGPAGGVAHRIMVPGHPDTHGPYIGIEYHILVQSIIYSYRILYIDIEYFIQVQNIIYGFRI